MPQVCLGECVLSLPCVQEAQGCFRESVSVLFSAFLLDHVSVCLHGLALILHTVCF